MAKAAEAQAAEAAPEAEAKPAAEKAAAKAGWQKVLGSDSVVGSNQQLCSI